MQGSANHGCLPTLELVGPATERPAFPVYGREQLA